jgi:hypothetical protein
MIVTAMMWRVEAKTLKIGLATKSCSLWEINYQTESS